MRKDTLLFFLLVIFLVYGCRSKIQKKEKIEPVRPSVFFSLPGIENKKNLLKNPGFENGDDKSDIPDEWTPAVGAKLDGVGKVDKTEETAAAYCRWTEEEVHSGKKALMLFSSKENCDVKWISKFIPVVPGHVYNLDFYLKLKDVKYDVRRKHWYKAAITYAFYDKDEKYICHRDTLKEYGTSEWIKYSNCFKAPEQAEFVKINFALFHTKGTAYLDDISLRKMSPEEAESIRNSEGKIFYRINAGNSPESGNMNYDNITVFKKENNTGYFPQYLPVKDEIMDKLNLEIARNETSFITFGCVLPPDIKKVNLSAGPFVNAEGEQLPVSEKDIRVVKYWPQRNLYKGNFYFYLPELLLRQSWAESSPRGRTVQFWIEVRTDSNTKPGSYSGYINFTSGKLFLHKLPVNIKVLPFELKNDPDDIRIISIRRPRVLKNIDVVFKDLTAHGINSLALAPKLGKFTLKNRKLVGINFSSLDSILKKWKEINGAKGVIVLRFGETLERHLGHIMGYKPEVYMAWKNINWPEDLKENFKTALKLFKEKVNEYGYECYYSGMDEAGVHPKVQERAVLQHKLAKEAGLKTYNTCDVLFTEKVMDPYLDARAYQASFLETAEEAAARKRECQKSGDKFLFYGSGTYMDEGIAPEEGTLIPNRYLNGFLCCKVAPDGHHVWGYYWYFGDAYDDFDGKRKDFLLVYPSRNINDPELVSTLQWEGVKEGINDFRYVYTLKELIEKAKKSDSKKLKQTADEAQIEMKSVLSKVPWQNDFRYHYSKYDDRYFDTLRARISHLILKLQE